MLSEILLRFLAGGILVSLFAAIADGMKPKSFAGLFGAAPSVALASLSLTLFYKDAHYAAIEARSMIAGAGGFFFYAIAVMHTLYRFRTPVLATTAGLLILWCIGSAALWWMMGAGV